MNIKKATNYNYQQLNLQDKQPEANNQKKERLIGMEIIWRVVSWEGGKAENGEKDARIKKHN